jgi:hypothetical protein
LDGHSVEANGSFIGRRSFGRRPFFLEGVSMFKGQDTKKVVSSRSSKPTGTGRPSTATPVWSAAAANVADSTTQSWEKYRECRLRQFAYGR